MSVQPETQENKEQTQKDPQATSQPGEGQQPNSDDQQNHLANEVSDGEGIGSSGGEYSDGEGKDYPEDDSAPGAAGKKKRKRRKKRRLRKKKQQTFDLTGINHLKPDRYNALKDEHLRGFFFSERVRKHLVKMNLVNIFLYRLPKMDISSKILKSIEKIKNC